MSEDTTPLVYCMEGNTGIYKTKNAVPHDLGDPGIYWAHTSYYFSIGVHACIFLPTFFIAALSISLIWV